IAVEVAHLVLEPALVEGFAIGSDGEAHLHIGHTLNANGNLQQVLRSEFGGKTSREERKEKREERSRAHFLFSLLASPFSSLVPIPPERRPPHEPEHPPMIRREESLHGGARGVPLVDVERAENRVLVLEEIGHDTADLPSAEFDARSRVGNEVPVEWGRGV